jgi:hypothetical protein
LRNGGGGNQKSPEARQRTAERERRILELRLQGAEFEDIGRRLGISMQAASKGYYRALRRIPEKVAVQARKEQLRRLDILRLKFYGRLAAPEVLQKEPIGCLLLKIEQREARILGTDAPAKVFMTQQEDPETASRRERQMEILGKLSLEERQEFLQLIQQSKEDKGAPDRGDSTEL